MSYGLLLLRLVLGLTMAAHGSQKLFGWWGGPGLRGMHGWLNSMRFRGGWLPVLLIVTAELGGGIALALGLLTPLAALGVVTAMMVAVWTVHKAKGFWNGNGGYEFNLLIVAAGAALAGTGPGRFSLDRAFGWDDNLSGVWWGVGVLAAGVVITFVLLTLGRQHETSPVGESDQSLRTA
jgi:putative oxidoreductase